MIMALVMSFVAVPVQAQTDGGDGGGDGDEPPVDLCSDANDAKETINTIFIILSALGPLFGSLFYVGLTVAEAASMEKSYGDKRRKVLIAGFSVPIAIAFLGVIANRLVQGADISCFFP